MNLASSTRGSARKAKQQKDRDETSSPPTKRRMDSSTGADLIPLPSSPPSVAQPEDTSLFSSPPQSRAGIIYWKNTSNLIFLCVKDKWLYVQCLKQPFKIVLLVVFSKSHYCHLNIMINRY